MRRARSACEPIGLGGATGIVVRSPILSIPWMGLAHAENSAVSSLNGKVEGIGADVDRDGVCARALRHATSSLFKIFLLAIAGLSVATGTPAIAQTAGAVEVYEGKYFYPATEPYSRVEDMGLVIIRQGNDLRGKFKVPLTWNNFGNPGGEMDLYRLEISGNAIRLNARGNNGQLMEIEGTITADKITGTMDYRGYTMKVDLRRIK